MEHMVLYGFWHDQLPACLLLLVVYSIYAYSGFSMGYFVYVLVLFLMLHCLVNLKIFMKSVVWLIGLNLKSCPWFWMFCSSLPNLNHELCLFSFPFYLDILKDVIVFVCFLLMYVEWVDSSSHSAFAFFFPPTILLFLVFIFDLDGLGFDLARCWSFFSV